MRLLAKKCTSSKAVGDSQGMGRQSTLQKVSCSESAISGSSYLAKIRRCSKTSLSLDRSLIDQCCTERQGSKAAAFYNLLTPLYCCCLRAC